MLDEGPRCGGGLRYALIAVQTFADFVADTLSMPAAPGSYRYLLVDTAATRPCKVALELGLLDHAVDILTGEPCAWNESVSPVLIELPGIALSAARCRRAAAELTRWRYANCYLYLESPHAPHAAIRLLRERTEAVLPQDMPVLLRYFDSRVFGVLLRTLSREQRSALLAPGTRWGVPGRRGELHCVEPEKDAPCADVVWPIRLDPSQEAELIEASDADAMIDLLLNQNNVNLQSLLPPEQHERISVALDTANELKIEQLSDRAAYCALTLEYGPAFHEREPWASRTHDVTGGRGSFASLLAPDAQGEEA